MKLLRAEVILFVTLLVLVMFVPVSGATADELHAAPLNPNFISFVKEKSYNSQVQVSTLGLGLAPSPIYRPEVRDVQMFGPNAGDSSTSYPSTYDLRTYNKVSPVKNQNPFGTCWAFATFGSLESTSMPATPTPDFSEKNLVNLAGFDYPPSPQNGGGDMWMSTAYLTRWNGPVNETTDPYPTTSVWTNSSTYLPVKHVQNVVFFPARTNRTDTDNIKGALTRWGAVYSSFYWGDTFYNATYFSYYQPASAPDPGDGGGHAVTIVGWNDTYAATNFNTVPAGPGAWIVKNSWGTNWGNGGYFYMSYYDKYFGSVLQSSTSQSSTSGDAMGPFALNASDSTAVFLGENTSNYSTVYSYDTLGEVNDYYDTTTKTGSFANVFTANTTETIKAVGFYTTDLNVPYTISIYKNPTSGPVGGIPAATFSGTLPYMGYNTVIIPSSQQVPVTTGDKFSVVIQVTNPTFNYYIPVEENYAGYTSGITSQSGQGYVLGGSTWTDWKTKVDNSHICIKAYTSSTTHAPIVNGITPNTGTTAGGTSVTISGSDFTGATLVTFGSIAASTFTINSATQITATSPVENAGTVDVTVTTSVGTSATSTFDRFTYVAPTSASTVGVFRQGAFYLASSNTPNGGTVTVFSFGQAGDVPVAGDWFGSSNDTSGLFRSGTFYLASRNTPGGGTVNAFNFGQAGDKPVAGHWSGRGTDTVGIFRNGMVFLASSNTPGGGTVNTFTFGQAGDVPVAGDWTGSGTDIVGIFRNGTFYLASSNTNGGGTVNAFTFGQVGDVPVAGDWNGDGKTEVGVFRNGMVFLASSNTNGGGTVNAFTYGQAGDVPVAGRFTTSTGSGNWTFVVFGDSPNPALNTTTGISPYLSVIATAVAQENPDLAIYVGDLVNGWILTNESPMYTNYSGQFRNWMDAVSPIHNYTAGTGIPLYVMRGNHEDGLDHTVLPLLETYRTTVASSMPKNGPPGEENLTYSFTHNGAKFIVTDDYIAHNGIKETVNQSWVDEQLTQDTRSFMFVFGHSPVYYVENETADFLYSLGVHPAEADTFWKSMVNNHVPAYFCGHTHMYVRGENKSVQQVICGNGGAEMSAFDPANVDPTLNLEYPKKSIATNDQKVGYLVINVHENSGTFDGVQKVYNATTQSWETGDRFTINAR